MVLHILGVFILVLQNFVVFAALYQSAEDLPDHGFDFIVIGGGTAGNVVANRLTENPRFSVLVLEAGGPDKDILVTQIPFYCNHLQASPYSWNYTTAPIDGLNGRSIAFPKGLILGGTSSINYMGYTRGSAEDYDRYARVTKDEGWSWERLQPYIRKNEDFVRPLHPNKLTGDYDPAAHGYHGTLAVSLPGYIHEIDSMVLQTTDELKDDFPYNHDTNSGNQLGFGWVQSTIKNGTRSSSSTSYLGPEFINRPNLHVLLNARVTRVLQSGGKKLAFRKVEFTQDSGATFQLLSANREVILSAGTVGTPSILLHSGIGNSSVLSSLGIRPIHHLPSVGQNLTEQPVIANHWFVNSTNTFETINRNATVMDEVLEEWETTRTGPLGSGLMGWIGFFRLPDEDPIWANFTDPAAGPNTGHFEFIVSNGLTRMPTPQTGNFLGLSSVLISPRSRGYITINSTNPLDAPVINPNLLASDFDIYALREAFIKTRLFTSAPVWHDSGYLISPVANVSDADLTEYIRNNAAAIYHSVGTASMSAKDADYGVVDPDLRVKGVDGLRIVDASVVPYVPAAHTQAVTYIFAERGSDLIKSSYSG